MGSAPPPRASVRWLGILVGLVLTPFVAQRSGMAGMLAAYGIVSVLGALVLPTLSDHARKRVPFVVLAVGLAGVTFASSSA